MPAPVAGAVVVALTEELSLLEALGGAIGEGEHFVSGADDGALCRSAASSAARIWP
jgi:hypothetical protein